MQVHVQRAAESGLIQLQSPRPADAFNHFQCGINALNARSLNPGLQRIAKLLADTRGAMTILELGPGAGNTAYELPTHFPAATVTMHTASLTPIDPWHPLLLSHHALTQAIATLRQTHGRQMRALIDHVEVQTLTIDTLGRLQQELGLEVFGHTTEPFIRQQFIGDWQQMTIPTDTYDLVTDTFGPLLHTKQADVPRAIERAAGFLNARGLLHIATYDASEQRLRQAASQLEGRMQLFRDQRDDSLVCTPITSPLCAELRTRRAWHIIRP